MEVEAKFRVVDASAVEARLAELGARLVSEVVEVDVYYNHPCRDFAASDEALRVRHVDGSVSLTYKGPRMGPGKTRREVSIGVDGDVESLLSALGFVEVARVVKRRRYYALGDVTVTVDRVEGLGEFVEVEVSVGDEGLVEEGFRRVMDVALRLGLDPGNMERRTYLELLLAKNR